MDMTQEGGRIARDAKERSAKRGQYLAWRLGPVEYGVDIQKVQEIRSYEEPTRVPASPECLKGVVNLRGVIVPIVDLRVKLGAEASYTASTVVVVLSVHGRVAGVVVDAVSDVVNLTQDSILPPPQLSQLEGGAASFVTGVASIDERMLLIADLDILLGELLGVPR